MTLTKRDLLIGGGAAAGGAFAAGVLAAPDTAVRHFAASASEDAVTVGHNPSELKLPLWFSARSDFISALAGSPPVPDGAVIACSGVMYQKVRNATAISDLAGFIPYGDPQPEHWGAVGDDRTPDTAAFQNAAFYAGQGHASRTVKLAPKSYLLGAIDIPWGVSLIGTPGTVLHVSGAISMTGPALFRFTTFRDIRFSASGIVPIGINAVAEFENVSVGQTCSLHIENCEFIARDQDIDNPGFRTSKSNFFHTAVYMYDVAFASFKGNTFIGGFEITGPAPAALESSAVKFDGQTVRFSWASDSNVQSYHYGIKGQGAVEGFTYEGGEQLYVRRGIHVETDVLAGGGWIKGGHFNCSERGVYFKSRKAVTILSVNAWRNPIYEARPDWAAVELDMCQGSLINGVISEFGTTGFKGTSDTVLLTNCQRVTVGATRGRYTSNNVRLVGSANITLDSLGGDGHVCGLSIDGASSDVSIGRLNFTNTANPLAVSSKAERVTYTQEKAKGDVSVRAISADGGETVLVRNTSWIRRSFAAGGGEYTYDIKLSADEARPGDEMKATIAVTSANARIRILSNDGAVLQTINAASGTYWFNAEFIGNWRMSAAGLSL